MEVFVFVTTSFVVCICIFASVAMIDRHRELSEIDFCKEVYEQLSRIQNYIDTLETVLRDKEEHIMKCILYSAVRLCRPIRGIKIESTVSLQFKDILVIDEKGERVAFKINRKTKQSWGYRVCNVSCFEEDKNELLIEFETPVLFKYIDFVDLRYCGPDTRIKLLTQEGDDVVVVVSKQKHVICNTVNQLKKGNMNCMYL